MNSSSKHFSYWSSLLTTQIFFRGDQLFDFIVHLIVVSQELLNNFFVGPKPDFKELFSRLLMTEDLNPLHDTNRPYSAPKFFITPPNWSKTIRSTGASVDLTWTQILGVPKPSVPAEARISTPLSGPAGLTYVVNPFARRMASTIFAKPCPLVFWIIRFVITPKASFSISRASSSSCGSCRIIWGAFFPAHVHWWRLLCDLPA